MRVLTVPFDAATGLFDDSAVRKHLAARELVRAEPAFFVHEGRPCWTVWLETRAAAASEAGEGPAPDVQEALSGLPPLVQGRYQRLAAWRREASRAAEVPAYVVLTNREVLEVAREAPRTLEGLRSIRGIGRKKVAKHGRAILSRPAPTVSDVAAASTIPRPTCGPPIATTTTRRTRTTTSGCVVAAHGRPDGRPPAWTPPPRTP